LDADLARREAASGSPQLERAEIERAMRKPTESLVDAHGVPSLCSMP
jgi:hypothetical protein